MSEEPTITYAENGPYLVKSLEKLTNSQGTDLETKATTALCRCGASANKPYCDGAHARVGFSGAKDPERTPDHLDEYPGENITIRDNRGICCHAGACTSGAPAVWRMGQEPWIDPDGADVDTVVQVIRRCPSGALSHAGDDVPDEDGGGGPAIEVSKDGPYHVRGAVELLGVTLGEGAQEERVALCRCGHSKNKPFCDGQHWSTKFSDPGN